MRCLISSLACEMLKTFYLRTFYHLLLPQPEIHPAVPIYNRSGTTSQPFL